MIKIFAVSFAILLALAEPRGWQAVAYSSSTGQDGYAFNQATKASAELNALEACDATDCRLIDVASACLTLVRSPSRALIGTSDVAIVSRPYDAQSRVSIPSSRLCGEEDCEVVRDVCLEVIRPEEPRV
jgi:hypothetical protein